MDTIFALSTPPGKSGVAVIRISGQQAARSLEALGVAVPSARKAVLAGLMSDGAVLDKALVLYFLAPHSFTGEDTVEYHIHGSRAVIRKLLDVLGALPFLRPAEPGEFTRRAFLNGKLDLTAAEGLADLIDAETDAQRRQALRFMQGEAAVFYGELRAGLLGALALTEAYIDFPDEDIPAWVLAETSDKVRGLAERIASQLADAGAAERVRDGVRVAIIGPPNVGKSSLMNLLARRDIAIVSEMAGTTRDVIEVHLDIGGFAVIVADTAGIREARDAVEREGIRRSFLRAQDADIRILVLDAQEAARDAWQVDEAFSGLIDKDTILVLNKTDVALPSPLPFINEVRPLAFSVRERIGLEPLLEMLAARMACTSAAESSYITRSRHRHHLTQALDHLRRYQASSAVGLELQCEELRRAAVEIGHITGIIHADEVLGHIFSRFCIGK